MDWLIVAIVLKLVLLIMIHVRNWMQLELVWIRMYFMVLLGKVVTTQLSII